MIQQRSHKQSKTITAHGSKARDGQRYKDPVNCSGGYLDPPNLADPLPPGFERARLSTFLGNRSSSTETLIACLDPPRAKPGFNQTRSSSKQLVFTPAQVYPIATSRSTTSYLARQSVSSAVFFNPCATSPPPYSKLPESLPEPPFCHMNSDTDDDRDEDEMIYTTRTSSQRRHSSQGLRSRIFGLASRNTSHIRDKPISTTPGVLCAGETETETDEPVSVRTLFHLWCSSLSLPGLPSAFPSL